MFDDRLTTTLTLGIGSAVHTLSAGQIERFELDLEAWGFCADLTFYVSSEQQPDPIFEGFSSTALIAVTLTFAREAEGASEAPGGVTVTGYAVARAASEVVGEKLSGEPVIGRRYELRVLDPARAFWTQHRPLELHVQASMQDMIEANKPTGVRMIYDWPAISTPQSVLTVGLDGEAEPSFYDFLLHWVDRNQGVFELDSVTGSYRLGAKKSSRSTAAALSSGDVARLRLVFPEPPRFVARVLQAFADAPLTRELPNALAAGIRRDVILRTPIAADVSQRAQLETSRLRVRQPGIEITYKRCPDCLTPPLGLLEVADGFSQRIYPAGTTYRVTRLYAAARHKPDVHVEPEEVTAVYEIELRVEAEDKLNALASLPAFRDPRRTLRVEGKIVSAGQAGQRSWAAIENEDNSLWMYKVYVPLFNKEVPAPFAPNFATGHFFFPAYKDQRVLLDLEFDRAFITGFLDWADEGRVPSDSQGNQIVLGFVSSNGTVIRHDYQNAIPVLNVQRKASIETTTLTLGDGTLHIGLEQSSAVPTSIPLYDVSPQVEAAKDAVVGEVGGSVTAVTTQFQAAVGQVAGSIEDTSATVQTQIAAAERKLSLQLDAAQAELQGLLADASAASASLALGGQRCKARLTAALQSMEALRAPLLALQARLASFRQHAQLQSKAIEAEIAQLPAVLGAPLEAALARSASVRERAKNRFASLRTEIASLSPRAHAGPFDELTRLRQQVQGLSAEIGQLRVRLEARVDAAVGSATAEWTQLDASLAGARSVSGASLSRASDKLDRDLARLSQQVQHKLGAAPPAARATLVSLSQRLAGVQGSVQPTTQRERARLDARLDSLSGQVSQGRAQLTAAASQASAPVQQALGAAESAQSSVLEGVDGLQTTLERAATDALARLEAGVRALEQAVLPVLDGVPAALAQARRSLEQAVQTALDTCRAALSAFDTLVSNVDGALRVPLEAALAALDAAEQGAQASMQAASQTLDNTLGTSQRTIDGFVSTFQSLVDGASDGLTRVRGLISGARAQIMPPIEALVELVEQLQSAFQTGVNLLTAFVDKAHAALEAIPAVSLPKAAVQPAITAIGTALDAVLPVIQTAAKTAGDQLGGLGDSLTGQVQAAENAGLSALDTLVDGLTQQVETLLPPVKTQLATVQAQIDGAIEEVLTQIDRATTLAVDGVTQSFSAAGAQAQRVVDAASAQLDQAQQQLEQALSSARGQLTTQRDALAARAQQLVEQVATRIDQAQAQLDGTAQQIEDGIARARDALEQQLTPARKSLEERCAALRAQLAQLPASLDQRLQSVTADNRARIAEITRLVPSAADIDAAVSAAVQPLTAAVASVDLELAML